MDICHPGTVRAKDLAGGADRSLHRGGGGRHTKVPLGQPSETGHPVSTVLPVGQWKGIADDTHLAE